MHRTFRTPTVSTFIIGAIVAVFAGVFPLDVLGELVSVGTLVCLILVCIGVIVLRYTKPDAKRPFNTPLFPWVPIAGVLVCGAMVYPLLITCGRDCSAGLRSVSSSTSYGIRHAKEPRWKL